MVSFASLKFFIHHSRQVQLSSFSPTLSHQNQTTKKQDRGLSLPLTVELTMVCETDSDVPVTFPKIDISLLSSEDELQKLSSIQLLWMLPGFYLCNLFRACSE